ncbi:MAG TPA: hypothetical protein P5279_06125 [Anaerohalosphaeraceae bacterium]|nr:hypothetical protein [Anaerohalosphaeraceae bacterium]HRT50049.1 hypothetical protein [Anaerohalosphaeraceae bacterium]HRT85852.1 hypothetical protein [Anaerohalosphaeraceae bacterium]
MLRKKTIIIGLLIGAFVITGSLVVLAQVAGDDVGRNILRMARQRNTGETVQETAEPEKSTAQTPAASVATPAAVTRRPAITVTDAVLSLLPADCLLCVRINTLDTSLGAFDQYITGVSPIPVSLALLAKGQLGELLSDPMLSGVNTQGDFVIFATPLPAGDGAPAAVPQIGIGMLVPVTGQEFFQRYTDSQLPGGKYALVALEPKMAESLTVVKKQMAASALLNGMAADVVRQSKDAPIWGYVNLAALIKAYGPIVFSQMDQALSQIPQSGASEMDAKMTAGMIQFFKTYAVQLDSLSLVVDPRPDTLNASLTLRALPNTELAEMLVRDPAMKSGYSMAGFLNEPAAVNILARINPALNARLQAAVMELMAEAMGEGLPAETMKEWQSLTQDWISIMGEEQAVSLSPAPGMPPVAIKQLTKVKDNKKAIGLLGKITDVLNPMYARMGVGAAVKVEAGETYRGSQIHAFQFVLPTPADATEEQRQMLEQMNMFGFNYRFAVTSGYLMVATGPNADADIKALIDQASVGSMPAARGDIQTVLAMAGAAETDFVASVNVPRLVSGIGGMMSAMPNPGGEAMASMFSGIEVPTKSCIGLTGSIAEGRATLQLMVPKQHLLEIVMVVGAMQQKIMEMQQMGPGVEF